MVDLSRMPIKKVNPPSAVASQPNGAVDEALLDIVDSANPLFKMATLPARGMKAMHAAIKRDLDIDLKTTGRGRTLAQQWQIFGGGQARYEPCSEEVFKHHEGLAKGLTKRFPAADRAAVAALLGVDIPPFEFWTKKPNSNGTLPAMAAVPGKSPHGLWCADDLALPDGGDKGSALDSLSDQVVNWLFDNELEFGFAHGTRSEKWHVQWWVGDTVPQAVLEFERDNPFVGNGTTTLERLQRQEDDMVKAIRVADRDAIFTASGIVLSWVSDPLDYDAAVRAGLAPPLETVETVDLTTLSALRLVGAIPPGFLESEFEQVIDDLPNAPPG